MKISEALSQARHNLSLKGVSNSKLDSLILLTHTFFVLGKVVSKEQIIFNPDLKLNNEQQKVFFELIARRAARQPVSQIVGKREFFGDDFFVTSDVLDPRPDSETLVELVLENFSDKNRQIKILEIGVGSGCLTISLLKKLEATQALGLDISEAALKICQKNIVSHQLEERFQILKSNLFDALKKPKMQLAIQENLQKFDLIISNPPYIPSSEIENLQEEVKSYEPRLALDGGADGLEFYRKIAAEANSFLQDDGKIIVEIGVGQSTEIIKIFAKNNFNLKAIKQDLSGIERALCFVIKN